MPLLRPSSLIPARKSKCVEDQRLIDDADGKLPWKKWGTYISERSWGSVREDYSGDGDAWNYLTHDQARSVAYRWGEDGLAGLCDSMQYLCFAPAFWNGRDPILKERAFGLANNEGNHGEDVKEYYYYLENTPSHSYAKYLYKYPQQPFPYDSLVQVNAARRDNLSSLEFELMDTGIFEQDRYFDIFVEYAKAAPETICIRVRAVNRGPESATLHFLPTLWFRDTWSWASAPASLPIRTARLLDPSASAARPRMFSTGHGGSSTPHVIQCTHPILGERFLHAPSPGAGKGALLFTENATNTQRLYGRPNAAPYCKDAFHEYVVHGLHSAVSPQLSGTKAAVHYVQNIPAANAANGPGEHTWTLVLTKDALPGNFSSEAVFAQRIAECDEFYGTVHPPEASPDDKQLQRQALAGMLWNKQFYFFDAQRWMDGDEKTASEESAGHPSPHRRNGKVARNANWRGLNADFVMAMPDKWEYPWFAAWDLSFQSVTLALVDPHFAKEQLLLLVSDALQHPNGQVPAYEWEFSDVNPPVQAWAAWKVYQSGKHHFGIKDRDFLERMFQKLLLNFAWWVNRLDASHNDIFGGGFLGLDNISVLDRSVQLPGGGTIEQSDGTAWMGLFSLNMMRIAFELALEDPVYEDMATKFFEHFMALADAINHDSSASTVDPLAALGLWDERDGFYYDQIRFPGGRTQTLKVRSLVGLLPMVASEILYDEDLERLPMFKARYEWFLENRKKLAKSILTSRDQGGKRLYLLSIVGEKRFRRILQRLLDEREFLSPYGLRSLSKIHESQPFELAVDGQIKVVRYEPADALSAVKGGNSNWRGPIWFPTSCLLLDTLTVFDKFIGDTVKFPFPANGGVAMSCNEIAGEIGQRMLNIFMRDPVTGKRPCYGGVERLQNDPNWRDYQLFFEYFHGDNGAGLGAMHLTGWTGFIANIIDRKYRMKAKVQTSRSQYPSSA